MARGAPRSDRRKSAKAPDPAELLAVLPLPAATFDAAGRWTGLNEAAELWLNLSSRSVAGLTADDPALAARLRVEPPLGPAVAAAAASEELIQYPRRMFDISDRAGGWTRRKAVLHLCPLADGGAVMLIRPEDSASTVRHGARSAIGMAEMLAHEIKNPLAGIRGAAQLLAEGLPPEDRELTDLIVAESRRIVALLEQVERFGDTTAPRCRAVNIHDILDRARRSIALGGAGDAQRTDGPRTEEQRTDAQRTEGQESEGQCGPARLRIMTDYDPSLPLALVDPDRIMQVILNLLRNAAEALARESRPPGDPRGAPMIRLRSFYDGGVRDGNGAPLPLQVEIEDDGPGIPEQIADQIFEPFVSGRENGSGLGLALVGKIVTEHGGRITADSRPGRTVFRLSLPIAREGES